MKIVLVVDSEIPKTGNYLDTINYLEDEYDLDDRNIQGIFDSIDDMLNFTEPNRKK